MKQLSKGILKIAFPFSKRVIQMKSAQVAINQNIQILPVKHTSTPINQSPKPKIISNEIPQDWQAMKFDKLCSLDSTVLQKIQLLIKKTKMNVDEQYFTSEKQIVNPQTELMPYWADIYKTLCNIKGISQQRIDKIKKNGYLAKMYLEEFENDEKLLQIIEIFVNNIHEVKELEGIAEPTFCKYLLSLKRDLKMQGLDINTHIDPTKKIVKILNVLSYEYEFWVDIKHNRSKNGRQEDFIIMKKTIDNPNNTIILTQQFPKVNVTYITRKKKRQERQMCFVIKILLQIEANGIKHVVKVQKKGPSSAKQQKQLRNQYMVIDYDGIFKGNPTIKPIFQF